MANLIDEYFANHLSLPWEDAVRLHKEYYMAYGLAIEGLVRHHQIDPLDYNAKVDDALPLEGIIKPSPHLRRLLEDVDRSKVRLWLFTNAHVTHGRRVVKLLGIEDLFDGLTYCDYSRVPLICKPSEESFRRAMREAGVERTEDCFFVGMFCRQECELAWPIADRERCLDDSFLNCSKAQEFGWTVAHLVEEGIPLPPSKASEHQIRHLEELRTVFPQLFLPSMAP